MSCHRFALLFGSFLICLGAGGAEPIVNNVPSGGGIAAVNGEVCPSAPTVVGCPNVNPPVLEGVCGCDV